MVQQRWNLQRVRSESAYWRSCILMTAGHLGVFAWIGNGTKGAAGFAAHFGGNRNDWEIFCDALCAMGLLRKRNEKYANTAFSSRHLTGGAASFLLPGYDDWHVWSRLASVLRNGKRPPSNQPFFSDLHRTRRLLGALHVDGLKIAPHLIDRLPLTDSRTLLDVGGGLGAFSIAFCRRYSKLQATIVEHPNAVALARRAIAQAGLAKRIRVMGLNFIRQDLPRGFDTVLVSNVLHSQSADDNQSLFSKIHNSLNPGGHLILRDVFMKRDRIAPEWGAVFSVALLLHTPNGRCYTLGDILGWLRRSGFSRIKGPFASSHVPFDPDSILIAGKATRARRNRQEEGNSNKQ
ncbi:MAG TPA: methyltransferase [Candidatus Binatia bacterium]